MTKVDRLEKKSTMNTSTLIFVILVGLIDRAAGLKCHYCPTADGDCMKSEMKVHDFKNGTACMVSYDGDYIFGAGIMESKSKCQRAIDPSYDAICCKEDLCNWPSSWTIAEIVGTVAGVIIIITIVLVGILFGLKPYLEKMYAKGFPYARYVNGDGLELALIEEQ